MSKGWISGAFFLGKNTTIIFPAFDFRDEEGGCVGQLSSRGTAF
jgi:hypothetical protein